MNCRLHGTNTQIAIEYLSISSQVVQNLASNIRDYDLSTYSNRIVTHDIKLFRKKDSNLNERIRLLPFADNLDYLRIQIHTTYLFWLKWILLIRIIALSECGLLHCSSTIHIYLLLFNACTWSITLKFWCSIAVYCRESWCYLRSI